MNKKYMKRIESIVVLLTISPWYQLMIFLKAVLFYENNNNANIVTDCSPSRMNFTTIDKYSVFKRGRQKGSIYMRCLICDFMLKNRLFLS